MNQSFNTSAQVERIREILVGRQLGEVEQRLANLEAVPTPPAYDEAFADFALPGAQRSAAPADDVLQRLKDLQTASIEQTRQLQEQMNAESELRRQQAEAFTSHIQHLHQSVETLVARTDGQQETSDRASAHELTSHIDARLREILQHLQSDILQWRNQMNRDLQTMSSAKVDHQQLQSRLSQIAAAAMAEDPVDPPEDGYLL